MTSRLSGGAPFPLGATIDRRGTNFALASVHAERVELCLFNPAGDKELERIRLPERTGDIWHGHVAGIGAGQLYGYRVYGPFDPARGHRFNHHKLLIDPYARAIDRPFRLAPSLYGHVKGDSRADLSFDTTDSAPDMPKAIVVAPSAAAASPGPRIPWQDAIIYELHAKGFTKLNAKVPAKLRGTLSGLAQPAALEHLTRLGVTTIELMPLAAFIDERHLPPLGLGNYWGYNPVTFLAPEPRYLANGGANARATIAKIHEAGIEVIVDVVFNHSGESDELGPTICYRGIDNATYYRLKPSDPRFYDNPTGCGHALAADRPIVLRLIMDAMRHWVTEFGVDGFRFDLAATLGRGEQGFDANGPFLAALRQDPLLSQVKLIAEPWDVGAGGYQGGAFPAGMAEWNDQFRDDVRRFWQGTSGIGPLASRLAGSSDRFNQPGRFPSDSINHVTAHDGFPLADLVSYTRKRNEANGEHNRDGTDQNHSWNHGTEGPSDDPAIVAARRNDMRALLATLLVSRGTPMLRAGDELGQSQSGNNNAYAQDNATTWIDWAKATQFADLTTFAQSLIALRKAHPALRRNRFLSGARMDGAYKDATWRRADGVEFGNGDWNVTSQLFIGLELFEADEDAEDHVYVMVNGGAALSATLPPATGQWKVALDSSRAAQVAHRIGVTLQVPARAVLVLVDDPKAPAQDHPEYLDRLARLAGIEPEHRDANGHDHVVSAETKRALLAAMRLPAGNAADIRASLKALETAPWHAPLPPFLVAQAGEPFAFEMITDRTDAGRMIEVRLSIEGGNARSLHLRPSEGSLVETRHIDSRVRETWRVATEMVLPTGLHTLAIGDVVATVAATPGRTWQPAILAGGGKGWGVSTNLYSARTEDDWGMGDFTALRQIGEQVAKRGGALVGINPLHALFPDKPDRASPYYPSDRRFLEAAYIDPRGLRGYAELAASDPWFAEAERMAAKLREATLIDYGAVFTLKRQVMAKLWQHFRDAGGESFAAFRRFVVEGGDSLRIFAAYEAAHANGDADFHMFLQFCADRALADAMTAANLPIGLYRDLAVGPAPDGAEFATGRDWFAANVSVGAPPDPYSDIGQVWGVPAYDPHALAREGYRPWIELLRANMRHAGALRLDHAMGIERLLWVPEGATANNGAYVKFDAAAMMALLAIESHRAKCMVVGEDLGTVPSGFRERMEQAGLYSMRVILFERDGLPFRPAQHYPPQSVAAFGSHDLPPFHGWWQQHQGDADGKALSNAIGPARDVNSASIVLHRFLSNSTAKVALAQLDDLAGSETQINVPGTTVERPNWRHRLQRNVPDIFEDAQAGAAIDAISTGRAASR